MTEQNNNIPEGSKMTELGALPKEWKVVKLINVATSNSDIVGGPFGSNLKVSDYMASGIPIIRLQNIERNRFINKEIKFISKEKADELKYHSFSAGDIVLAKLGDPIGKTCIVPYDLVEGIVVADVVRIRTNPTVTDKNYLVYALNTDLCEDQFRSQKTGTTRPRVNVSNVRNLNIPLAPIVEQKEIARVLSAIKKAVEAQDKIIAAARELKKSLMHHLFNYGPVSVTEAEKVPLKETEIGPVPEHWEVVRLGELGEIITGTTPSTKVAEYYGELHMFITPGDIYQTKYIAKTQKYLSDKGLSVSRPLPRDTVLVVCIGATIGKTAMTSVNDSVTNQQINSIITNLRTEPNYCFYAVTHYSQLLPALAGRVAIPIVNKSNFSKFLIPLPPISEQQKIASTLSIVDNKIESEENRKAALQALFKTMLHHLMTGKVRVKEMEAHVS